MTGKELATKYGFFTENTGGGCEALVKRYRKYDVVITVQDDPSVPDDPHTEPISIGVYTDFMEDREDEQNESLVDFYQPSLNTFFQNEAGRIWEFLDDILI